MLFLFMWHLHILLVVPELEVVARCLLLSPLPFVVMRLPSPLPVCQLALIPANRPFVLEILLLLFIRRFTSPTRDRFLIPSSPLFDIPS
jgi:hypothetical protein